MVTCAEASPRGCELGAVGNHQQHPHVLQAVDLPRQGFQAARVNPVHILEDVQHRLLLRQASHLVDQYLDGLVFLPLRTQSERRIAVASGDR